MPAAGTEGVEARLLHVDKRVLHDDERNPINNESRAKRGNKWIDLDNHDQKGVQRANAGADQKCSEKIDFRRQSQSGRQQRCDHGAQRKPRSRRQIETARQNDVGCADGHDADRGPLAKDVEEIAHA
jgi:hypothetical protein